MRPIQKAIIVGIMTIVVYLSVVVITTPALEPLAAISAAFQINSIVIFEMGIGIGLQVFLSSKSKLLGWALIIVGILLILTGIIIWTGKIKESDFGFFNNWMIKVGFIIKVYCDCLLFLLPFSLKSL